MQTVMMTYYLSVQITSKQSKQISFDFVDDVANGNFSLNCVQHSYSSVECRIALYFQRDDNYHVEIDVPCKL
jgi:hypothetical protein